MDEFWTWAATLPGRNLQTVTGSPFVVADAHERRGVTVVPKSSGLPRMIRPVELERTLALGLRGNGLTPGQVRDRGASQTNPSYVAAIVHVYHAECGGTQTSVLTPVSQALLILEKRPGPCPGPSDKFTGPVRSATRMAGTPSLIDEVQDCDPSTTLLVVPCSGSKASGALGFGGPSIMDELPEALAARLGDARHSMVIRANVDVRRVMPAWNRYNGSFYDAAGPAIEDAVNSGASFVIISGGYGVVLAIEPIGTYNARFSLGAWPADLLQHCLASFVNRHGLRNMVAFLSSSGDYAELIRSTAWKAAGVVRAFLVSPRFDGIGSAQQRVPRATGEAFAAYWQRDLHRDWTSSSGLTLGVERLI